MDFSTDFSNVKNSCIKVETLSACIAHLTRTPPTNYVLSPFLIISEVDLVVDRIHPYSQSNNAAFCVIWSMFVRLAVYIVLHLNNFFPVQ